LTVGQYWQLFSDILKDFVMAMDHSISHGFIKQLSRPSNCPETEDRDNKVMSYLWWDYFCSNIFKFLFTQIRYGIRFIGPRSTLSPPDPLWFCLFLGILLIMRWKEKSGRKPKNTVSTGLAHQTFRYKTSHP
jgi:hypothetical protein